MWEKVLIGIGNYIIGQLFSWLTDWFGDWVRDLKKSRIQKKIDDAASTDDPMERLDKIQDVADALGN